MLQELGPIVLMGREVEGICCGAADGFSEAVTPWWYGCSWKRQPTASMAAIGLRELTDLASPESPQEMLIGALCLKARATTDLISAVLK